MATESKPGLRARQAQATRDEIVGRHVSVFYPEEDVRARKPGRELEVATEKGRVEDEGWRVRKDGTMFWANVVLTAVRDDEGRLLGFSKITGDLTERRVLVVEAGERVVAVRRDDGPIARASHPQLEQRGELRLVLDDQDPLSHRCAPGWRAPQDSPAQPWSRRWATLDRRAGREGSAG